MTRNQIAFAEHKENKRHNQELERQGRSGLSETHRANVAKESENYRSNVAREQENLRSHLINEAETRRSNLAQEDLSHYRNVTDRVRLGEQNRANVANEDLKRDQLDHQIAQDFLQQSLKSSELEATNRLKRAQTNLVNEEAKYYGRQKDQEQAQGVVKFIKDTFETAAEVGRVLGGAFR